MADVLVPLVGAHTLIKVSSTLDKSVGKQNLTDGNVETCWTSQQGLPQFIRLTFDQAVILKRVSFVFQGGFVGIRCSVQISVSTGAIKEWQPFTNIYPEDVNRRQTFDLQPIDPSLTDKAVMAIKLVFEESSDFFGRITLYDLQIDGIVIA